MANAFERKMVAFCKKHECEPVWRDMQFGHKSVELMFDAQHKNAYFETLAAAKGLRNVNIETNRYWQGEFEGWIRIMDQRDYEDMRSKIDAEQARVWDWWQRLHEADPETQRLMRCGQIP